MKGSLSILNVREWPSVPDEATVTMTDYAAFLESEIASTDSALDLIQAGVSDKAAVRSFFEALDKRARVIEKLQSRLEQG